MYPSPKSFSNKSCSSGCVYNWTNFNQKPPIWQHCNCHPPKTNLKN